MSEKQEIVPVTFSVDAKLLDEFDEARREGYYSTRSAALQQAMIDLIRKIRRKR